MRSSPPSIGQRSPSRNSHEVLPAIHAEVAPHVRARDVSILRVRPGHPVVPAANGDVREHLHVVGEALRSDVPLHEPARAEVVVVERPDLRGEHDLPELVRVDLAIAGDQDRRRRPGHVEHHALQRPGRLHVQQRRQGLDRRRVRGIDHGERRRSCRGGLRRLWPGRLGVGAVVAVLAFDEQILADARACQELVVDAAADLPRVRLHDRRVQSESIEDAFVCLVHDSVRLPHAVLVAVDRVRVLHQELAYAKHPEPGTELVAVFPLDLVDVLRQVTIGREVGGRHQGDDLFLRGAEDEVAIVTIRQLEERVPVEVVAAGRPPRIGRKDDRHPQLDRTCLVHLLTDDGLDPPHRPQAEREDRVHPGHHLPHEPAPEQETMTRDLSFRGIFTQRRHERSGEAHGFHRIAARPAPSLTPPLLSRHNRRLMQMHGMTWTWRRGSRSLMPARP